MQTHRKPPDHLLQDFNKSRVISVSPEDWPLTHAPDAIIAIMKLSVALLCVLAAPCFADEPGPHYKLVDQTKPDSELEFFGGPHIDIVKEVYRRTDEGSPTFKIVLSSLADPSKKELLFAYDRAAEADLSPDGKCFVINDRPGRGECDPRLFKQRTGLKFTEFKEANLYRFFNCW